MASTFIALDIASGESFLLLTDVKGKQVAILIDSGKLSSTTTHPLLLAITKAMPTLQHIDICVCTHQDKDHAHGFRDFPDQWCQTGNTIGEFWLPGKWSTNIQSLIWSPAKFFSMVMLGAQTLAESVGPTLTDSILDSLRTEKQSELDEKEIQPVGELSEERFDENGFHRSNKLAQSFGLSIDDFEFLQEALNDRDEFDEISIEYYFQQSRHFQLPIASILAFGAFRAAESIRRIVNAAVRNRIPIRWFDFDEFLKTKTPIGGDADLLEPINSVELAGPITTLSAKTLCLSLYLSPANVESLVFYRPETKSEPAVFFLADSRLAFGTSRPKGDFPAPKKLPTRGSIITAPHHGSQVNDHAFLVLNSWSIATHNNLFVRNGGQLGQTLGQYRLQTPRLCAQCVQCYGTGWSQMIRITTMANNWSPCLVSFVPCK